MWTTALKFLAILFLKNRMQFAKVNFFKKLNTNSSDDLNQLKQNIAGYLLQTFHKNWGHQNQKCRN